MWTLNDQGQAQQVEAISRGLQFGDGVFETMRVSKGKLLAKQQHVARLSQSLSRLFISQPREGLEYWFNGAVEQLLSVSQLKEASIKLIVVRADSARGYGFKSGDDQASRCFIFLSPFQSLEPTCYEQGVSLAKCHTHCSIQPQLAGMKHLNRLENVLAKNELKSDVFEGLMSNYLGHVIEGTMSNIFFEKAGQLYTPDLSLSGVAGVMRDLCVSYCQKRDIPVNIQVIEAHELASFEHAFICNSLLGVVPIKNMLDRDCLVGSITRTLEQAWRSGSLYE